MSNEAVKQSTRGWDARRIAVFASDEGDVIAYVPGDVFQIRVVLFIKSDGVIYARVCFGDCTKTSPRHHVLRCVTDQGDVAQELRRQDRELWYADPSAGQEVRYMQRRLGTYRIERDDAGTIVGVTLVQ